MDYIFRMSRRILTILVLCCFVGVIRTKKFDSKEKPDWAKKDIRDYNDADLERYDSLCHSALIDLYFIYNSFFLDF